MEFDKIDKYILNVLFENGRESLTNIAEKLSKSSLGVMSHTGIRKRIRKLQDACILKIQGNINIKRLKYQSVFILMEMKNYDEQRKIIEAYLECPRIFFLATITGQFNLMIGVIGQSLDVLQQYLNFCGPTNKEGVLHSDVFYVSNFEVPEFLHINFFSNQSHETQCGNICIKCEAFLNGQCKGCGKF